MDKDRNKNTDGFPRGDYELDQNCLCGEPAEAHENGKGLCKKTGCFMFRGGWNQKRIVDAFNADCEAKIELNNWQPITHRIQ